MKKIGLLFLAICLVGCAANEPKKNEEKNTSYCDDENASSCTLEESADMSDYENFTDKNNQFVKTELSSVLSIIEKKQDAVVYFGFPKCPWCVEALPILNDVAKETKMEVLYVQTRDNEKKSLISDDEKQRMMDFADKFLQKDDEGEKQFYVPFVVTIKKGVVTAGHVGTVDGYDTSERKMNTDEKQQLKDIYLQMLKK